MCGEDWLVPIVPSEEQWNHLRSQVATWGSLVVNPRERALLREQGYTGPFIVSADLPTVQENDAQFRQLREGHWRLEPETAPSPRVTVNHQPVAWVESPLLADPHQLARARAQAQQQYQHFMEEQ